MQPRDTDFVDSEGFPTAPNDRFSDVNPHHHPQPDAAPSPSPTLRAGKKPAVKNVKMVGYVFGAWALASAVFGLIFSQVKGGTTNNALTIVVYVSNPLSVLGASLMLASMSHMSPSQRETFHLVFCSSSANLMAALIQIGVDIGQGSSFNGSCQMQGVAYQLLALMKLFWDTLLSVHVLLLFLAPLQYGRKHHLYRIYFHSVGWGSTILFALIPLLTRSYVIATPGQHFCWLRGSSIIYFYFLPFAICVISNVAIMAYLSYQLLNPPRVISRDVRLSALVWIMCLALWSTCANIWFIPYDAGIPGTAWTVLLGQMFTGLSGFVHCLIWLPKIINSMRKLRQDKLLRLGLSPTGSLRHQTSSSGDAGKPRLTSLKITFNWMHHDSLHSGSSSPSPRAITPAIESDGNGL